ncbi:uncharacterized protein TNCT_115611 [Trichonephila clavata]|uniref:Pre-C2HC domain-containing protein n=1 Tax=Trichonephila clavata TaxID=2740835 RepID=A0A8X6J779_TRICU|nr:uncharacterized protein TNCT_115611 [Trichonephila clavata]
MTSLDSGAQVDYRSVNMEDVSVPSLTDEDKCAKLTSLEKQCRILSARRDYVAEMIEIENAIPSNTSEMTQQLEEDAANLDEKIKMLEGKMCVLLLCPVLLCTHNFKYKSIKKRMAEPIIRPAKLNPKNSKTENVKNNDFKIPRKTAKNVPVEINNKIQTNNSFAALNTANKDAEEVTTPKIRPIMMKLFNDFNLISQDLHKTHPTATNTHVGGYIKIQAESEKHHREITQILTEKKIQYYAIDPPDNRPLKFVIKGLLDTAKLEDIKADLISKGIKIEKVAQLRQFQTKSTLPIFMIEITRDENVEDIFKIRSCLYMQIKIEPFNKKSKITQCYNCNYFHHASSHMASSTVCPLFPKPRKGKGKSAKENKKRNETTQNVTTTITSNLRFAQAVSNNIPNQMAARVNDSSASSNDNNQNKDKIPTEAIKAIQKKKDNFTFLHAIMEIKTIYLHFSQTYFQKWKYLLNVRIQQTS